MKTVLKILLLCSFFLVSQAYAQGPGGGAGAGAGAGGGAGGGPDGDRMLGFVENTFRAKAETPTDSDSSTVLRGSDLSVSFPADPSKIVQWSAFAGSEGSIQHGWAEIHGNFKADVGMGGLFTSHGYLYARANGGKQAGIRKAYLDPKKAPANATFHFVGETGTLPGYRISVSLEGEARWRGDGVSPHAAPPKSPLAASAEIEVIVRDRDGIIVLQTKVKRDQTDRDLYFREVSDPLWLAPGFTVDVWIKMDSAVNTDDGLGYAESRIVATVSSGYFH